MVRTKPASSRAHRGLFGSLLLRAPGLQTATSDRVLAPRHVFSLANGASLTRGHRQDSQRKLLLKAALPRSRRLHPSDANKHLVRKPNGKKKPRSSQSHLVGGIKLTREPMAVQTRRHRGSKNRNPQALGPWGSASGKLPPRGEELTPRQPEAQRGGPQPRRRSRLLLPAGPPAAQADLPEGPREPNSTGSKGSLACPRDGIVPKLVSTHLSAPSAQSTEHTRADGRNGCGKDSSTRLRRTHSAHRVRTARCHLVTPVVPCLSPETAQSKEGKSTQTRLHPHNVKTGAPAPKPPKGAELARPGSAPWPPRRPGREEACEGPWSSKTRPRMAAGCHPPPILSAQSTDMDEHGQRSQNTEALTRAI